MTTKIAHLLGQEESLSGNERARTRATAWFGIFSRHHPPPPKATALDELEKINFPPRFFVRFQMAFPYLPYFCLACTKGIVYLSLWCRIAQW